MCKSRSQLLDTAVTLNENENNYGCLTGSNQMSFVTPTVSIPIQTDNNGTIRIADTRVTLDVVIARFQQGRTPEQIQASFPTLKLADIYAVLTYYLNSQEEVDAYLRQQREEAARLRQEIKANQLQAEALRARLVAQMDTPQENSGCAFSPTKTSTTTSYEACEMRLARIVPFLM